MSTIYPTGFMAGIFRPTADAEQAYVRTGRRLHSLDMLDFDLWSLAHTAPDSPAARWTRADLLAAHLAELRQADPDDTDPWAVELDVAPAEAAIARMLASGLLVAVAPRDGRFEAGPVEPLTEAGFADTHRFRGLLDGLGNPTEYETQQLVGTPSGIVTALSASAYELWRLADRAGTLRQVAEQRAADAAERGEQVTTEDALAAVLPELRNLVSRGVGYFDSLPSTGGPLRYLASAQIPIDLAMMDDLRGLGHGQLPGEDEYRSLVAGDPSGGRYLLQDPGTGQDVEFAGYVEGTFFDTVASLQGRTLSTIVLRARRQLAAAGECRIVWHVQQADDVDSVRQMLQDAGITGIEVRHTPSP